MRRTDAPPDNPAIIVAMVYYIVFKVAGCFKMVLYCSLYSEDIVCCVYMSTIESRNVVADSIMITQVVTDSGIV